MNRRSFLKNMGLASTSMLVPQFLQFPLGKTLHASRSGKILVVIQLSGGNDGLNTVIPYRNDLYYQLRPTLSIPAAEALPIHDQLGLHPEMGALRSLYDQGLVSILNQVGYPNPDRSHFRSMDIWHTGSDSQDYWSTGWLGRYLDSQCSGCEKPHFAIEADDSLSLALKGQARRGFAVKDPARLKKAANNPFLLDAAHAHHHDDHSNLSYLYKTLIDTQASADYLHEKARTYTSTTTYPSGPFGKGLKQIAELITADTDTRIYYISLGSFDTHANQKGQQGRLLKQYAEGVKAFVEDMQQHQLLDDVLVLTFSEFGRRVQQNGSGGTDHGTANNLFLMGGQLKNPGFFNAEPDLLDLDEGDLRYQIDFRSVYATILEDWLEGSASAILQRPFDKVPLL